MSELLNGLISTTVGELIADLFGESIDERIDRRALRRAIERAVTRAAQEFAAEYARVDPQVTAALAGSTRFADLPSVRAALRELLARPFHDPAAPLAALRRSFDDVLPQSTERERVDAAAGAFLAILGREVLYIPQLRDLYALSFQKTSAESSRTMARHAEAMAATLRALHAELQQLAAAPPPPLLPAPPAPRPRPLHNLPQRTYAEFIGRRQELEQLARLMLPHPRSRHFVVTIDGIGGVGKSALALELAYGYRDGYESLPEPERFAAIVWVSAKRTLLTAQGIRQRRQSFTTLDDLFDELALALDRPDILRAAGSQRRAVVERALAEQRTLLIIDNLETVDDEELLTFLRELPDPTKALITTRHRIDIAFPLRLEGMPEADARRLVAGEAEAKGVALDPALFPELFRRTGGVPLAIIWSVGLMGLGHSPEAVLRRLGQGQSDIARFCFAESVGAIRGRDSHRLLLALALFERSVSRAMLGEVAGLADDVVGRDDGLAELLRLSLVNRKGDRFKLLPLTHAYAREELAQHAELARELRERWIERLTSLSGRYRSPHHLQQSAEYLLREGQHLESLAHWAEQEQRPAVYMAALPALIVYGDVTGNWSDLLDVCRQGLAYADMIGEHDLLPLIFCAMSWVHSQRGHHADAEQAIRTAVEEARRNGDLEWEVETVGRYGQIMRRAGDLDAAEQHFAEALALCDRLAPPLADFARADLEFERGKIARDRGDFETAYRLFVEAQQTFPDDSEQPAYNPERAWGITGNIGYVLHRMGDLDAAADRYQRSLAFFRESGGRGYTATLLVRCARLELERGNLAEARACAAEALELSRKLSMVIELRQAEEILARLGDAAPPA